MFHNTSVNASTAAMDILVRAGAGALCVNPRVHRSFDSNWWKYHSTLLCDFGRWMLIGTYIYRTEHQQHS